MPKRRTTKKVRKLLKAEATPRGVEYVTTMSDCRRWFATLNDELFEGTLPKIPFEFKRLRVCWAYFQYWPRKPEMAEKIVMNATYPSKRLFVETLAHEMIHQWQYQELGWRKVDHAEEFLDWSRKAKRLGLRIGEEQSE